MQTWFLASIMESDLNFRTELGKFDRILVVLQTRLPTHTFTWDQANQKKKFTIRLYFKKINQIYEINH